MPARARSRLRQLRVGLVHRRGLGQRHEQDLGEVRVAQARQQALHLLGAAAGVRSTSRWYDSAASSSSRCGPVGAVSMTTKPSAPSSTISANARKTAISSVQGLRRSSSSSARPAASRFGAGRGAAPRRCRRASRPPGRCGSHEVRRRRRRAASATWAAGSVVVRCTAWPRCASATAMLRRRWSCRRRPCPWS
jgi:hypothetical protein